MFGGLVASFRDFAFTFETDLANVTTSWKIIPIREVNSVFQNDVKLSERILLLYDMRAMTTCWKRPIYALGWCSLITKLI